MTQPSSDADEPLFIRLYLDEMVHPWFAEALRNDRWDAVSAREAGLLTAADEEHLGLAAAEGRVLFTCNVADARHNFQAIHAAWLSSGRRHSGILVCPQEQVSRNPLAVLARLARFLNSVTADEMRDQLRWLP